MQNVSGTPYALIPAIHELQQRCAAEPDLQSVRPDVIKRIARQYVDMLRMEIQSGQMPRHRTDLIERFPAYVRQLLHPAYRPVINATGVMLHTNLGRAPLPSEAIHRLNDVLAGYLDLEYDLAAGRRGQREARLAQKFQWLLNCGDAVIVNNNAAAVLLVLTALARDRRVLVSRGELIEIGGKFRLPEIFALSGAHLVEVGTTNRTRLADYIHAVDDATVGVLRVHPSNYRIVGFTETPVLRELTEWAHSRGLFVWMDLGSGLIAHPDVPLSGRDEPTVQEVLAQGCDLVCFSGDKIFGGPQAGIIVGSRTQCAQIRKHPLYRAVRVDKMTLIALDTVLDLHLRTDAADRIPVLAMLRTPLRRLYMRARRLQQWLHRRWSSGGHGLTVHVQRDVAYIGGGLAPTTHIPSVAVVIRTEHVATIARALRLGHPPVVARIEQDALVLNLRTVRADQLQSLARCLDAAIRQAGMDSYGQNSNGRPHDAG